MGENLFRGSLLGVPSFCVSPLQWGLGASCIKFWAEAERDFFIGLGGTGCVQFLLSGCGQCGHQAVAHYYGCKNFRQWDGSRAHYYRSIFIWQWEGATVSICTQKNTKKMGDIMCPASSTYKDFENFLKNFSNVFVFQKSAVNLPLKSNRISQGVL